MRTKQEILKAAIATDATLRHARKLVEVFGDPRYASLREVGQGIEVELATCEAFKLTVTAICSFLPEDPEVKFPEFAKILTSMRKAKKTLKESIRVHRTYLKEKL